MLTDILAKHSILDQIKRAELNRVLHETKRLVCLCCRVHTGNNLSDLVQQECTPEHEEKYKQLFSKNLMEDKQKIKENIKLLKEENMIRKSYEIFKSRSLKIIVFSPFRESFRKSLFRCQFLEVPSWDYFFIAGKRCDEEIIKHIASDIRDQHRLRTERKLELSKLKDTFERLNTKVC